MPEIPLSEYTDPRIFEAVDARRAADAERFNECMKYADWLNERERERETEASEEDIW